MKVDNSHTEPTETIADLGIARWENEGGATMAAASKRIAPGPSTMSSPGSRRASTAAR